MILDMMKRFGKMNKLAQDLRSNFGVTLEPQFASRAVYHHGLDFIEYVADDCFVVAGRIDEYLTVLKDGDTGELVGFKLKGFAYLYNEFVKPYLGDAALPFLDIVPVLTYLAGRVGDGVFGAVDKRKTAYGNVIQFAARRKVTVDSSELPRVA
jgi:hypothetical protein